ncbi:uncharacterized protein VTP21DRAFT_3266 [Calcarisporiella thermophila]|uniref:uncharacterized protein n=1 Tax=Calcarisporiella thermophila TaxID=911321 RepID=UPI0037429B1E
MDRLPTKKPHVQQWKPMDFVAYRVVRRIEGKYLHLDAPLTMAISKEYGGGFVVKYENRRLRHIGLQDLVFECPANKGKTRADYKDIPRGRDYKFSPEMFFNYVARFKHVEHSWMHNVNSTYFHNFLSLNAGTKHNTISKCHHFYPSFSNPPLFSGQSAFHFDGQLNLLDRCHADYSFHSYAFMGRVQGPNVLLKCTATGSGDVGPHMRWSTGQLYDGINIEGKLVIQDRKDSGTGHGWAGANSLVWNSRCQGGIVVQQPPTAQNFAIGSTDKLAKQIVSWHRRGWWESAGSPVGPSSLYEAQLEERLRRKPSAWREQ